LTSLIFIKNSDPILNFESTVIKEEISMAKDLPNMQHPGRIHEVCVLQN